MPDDIKAAAGRIRLQYPGSYDHVDDNTLVDAVVEKGLGPRFGIGGNQGRTSVTVEQQEPPPAPRAVSPAADIATRVGSIVLPIIGGAAEYLLPKGTPTLVKMGLNAVGAGAGQAVSEYAKRKVAGEPVSIGDLSIPQGAMLEQLASDVITKPFGMAGKYSSAAHTAENAPVTRAVEKYEVPLTPGERLGKEPGGGTWRFIQQLGESSPLGRRTAEARLVKAEQQGQQAIQDIRQPLGKVPQSRMAAGADIQEAIPEGKKAWDSFKKTLYDKATIQGQNAETDITNLAKLSQDIRTNVIDAIEKRGEIEQIPKATKIALEAVDKTYANSRGGKIPFSEAVELTQALNRINPEPNQLFSSADQALVKRLRGQMGQSIDTQTTGSMSQEAVKSLRVANEYHKRGAEIFGGTIGDTARGAPEKALENTQGNYGSVVKQTREAIYDYARLHGGTPEAKKAAQESWNTYRQQWLQDNVIKSGSIEDLRNMAKSIKSFGKDVTDEMFMKDSAGREVFTNLSDLSSAMERVTLPPAIKSGYFYWIVRAIGSVAALKGEPIVGGLGVAGMELVPGAVASMVHSKTVTDAVIDGFKKLETMSNKVGLTTGMATDVAARVLRSVGHGIIEARQPGAEAPPESQQGKILDLREPPAAASKPKSQEIPQGRKQLFQVNPKADSVFK